MVSIFISDLVGVGCKGSEILSVKSKISLRQKWLYSGTNRIIHCVREKSKPLDNVR